MHLFRCVLHVTTGNVVVGRHPPVSRGGPENDGGVVAAIR